MPRDRWTFVIIIVLASFPSSAEPWWAGHLSATIIHHGGCKAGCARGGGETDVPLSIDLIDIVAEYMGTVHSTLQVDDDCNHVGGGRRHSAAETDHTRWCSLMWIVINNSFWTRACCMPLQDSVLTAWRAMDSAWHAFAESVHLLPTIHFLHVQRTIIDCISLIVRLKDWEIQRLECLQFYAFENYMKLSNSSIELQKTMVSRPLEKHWDLGLYLQTPKDHVFISRLLIIS